jgi:hypothetical protein
LRARSKTQVDIEGYPRNERTIAEADQVQHLAALRLLFEPPHHGHAHSEGAPSELTPLLQAEFRKMPARKASYAR